MPAQFDIRRLGPDDNADARRLNALFGEAFDETDEYCASPPSDRYLTDLLSNPAIVALGAFCDGVAIGGLVAYEFQKFESERSEFYVYDLAVAEAHRRRGVASALIDALKPIAAARGGYILIIQTEPDNSPAATLYGKIGVREDVLSFDIAVADD